MNTSTILAQPKILTQGNKITIEIPMKILEKLLRYKKDNILEARKRKAWSLIEGLYGIWKNKDIDPLEYERKIRSEWNR